MIRPISSNQILLEFVLNGTFSRKISSRRLLLKAGRYICISCEREKRERWKERERKIIERKSDLLDGLIKRKMYG